jgi:hypothetical protein
VLDRPGNVVALFSDYKGQQNADGSFSHPNWLITDTRFPNELEAAKTHNGITIKIVRESGNTIGTTHASETALDDYTKWDYVVDNNGSLEDLKTQILSILEILVIIQFNIILSL